MTDSNIVETIFKTEEGYNECDHCQSVLSPVAYFVKLVETIEKYIPTHQLKTRRPDLFKLPLNCDSTNKTKLYLEIVNEIMQKNLDSKLGVNALQKLAITKYPFNLPANLPLISIRAYLEKQGVNLADLYKMLKPEADNVAESLSLSPEEYEVIIATSSNFSEVYGASDSELKNVEKFIAQTNIDFDKLELLLDCYNKIKKLASPVELTIGNETRSVNGKDKTVQIIKNLNDQALGFLHRFIRLANKLSWSFDELYYVLIAIDKNEIDQGSLKEISRIKSLQEKFKKPLVEVCKLYSNGAISIEESKSEEDANNAAESLFFLQGVKESDLKKEYGIEELSEQFKEQNFDEFVAEKGLKPQEVERLLNNYNNSQSSTNVKKIKKPVKQEVRSKISAKEQKFLYNFTQLTAVLTLLFSKLNKLIKILPDTFRLKDLITNVNDSIVLQKIWNISDNELTSLVNYNDQVSDKTEKSLILEAHKQILLARLMNISIAEVIQISLQLNINELTVDNVTQIIELNDWLNDNSITIEQLSTLVNSSALSHQYTEQISKICEELEKDQELKHDGTEDQKKAFYNAILQCIGEGDSPLKSVNEEGLAATDEFTKKQPTDLQLLRLESLDKSIVHDVGIIGNRAVFLGESKVLKKNSMEHSLREPRENVGVATIGKKTIFFGGKKGENEYSRKIDIYDEGTKRWSTETASETRDSAAAAVVDNKAIFFGGNKSRKECSSKIDIYDDETQQWKELATNEARANASVGVIGKKAIFFGGKINDVMSSAIDIYENGNWTTHTASEARANASVAVVDTKVIFFGGSKEDHQPSDKVDIYDAADIGVYRTDPTKRWTTHTISEVRENASLAVVDDKAIFFGGKVGKTRSNKIDIYDAKTEKWLEVKYTASEARYSVSVAVVGEQAIFFGGYKGDNQYSKYIEVYDSATNSWKATSEISGTHESVSSVVIGTKAIFFTGKKSSTVTGQVYIYDSTGYSKDESIAKSWIKRTLKEAEVRDDLLVNITNSTKYSGKVDIYDNTAKSWRTVNLYKPDKCKSIRIHNNRVTLTYQDIGSSTYDHTYTIGLSITYDATIEELLNNAAVFTVLKMDAEDINNITNHADTYNLKATWTEEQIKTLVNYKTLQDEFSGNELTLSQYTEWLRGSYDESKVIEKIAKLTNWDKELLNQIKGIDIFGQCFKKEHNPLDSLLKIKSFMDMSEQSVIDGKILLELKDLHDLPASTGWAKYNSTAKKLQESLNYVEGVKEQLEDQKRNVLASYMLHTYSEIKNKNMRGLYAFLLIDVEMSDCSKISPLKAGLNSLQLYIHRCILGLEEGAAVNQNPETGLSEGMWDLLSNYREWEVTKKIALYPENYLNPTLRKSATAEYKALQNTLMQGNIDNEAAAYAYIKYFEDLAQLVSLKIVDTYFESEKKILYIIGRTIAEPYIYYYRVGNFESDTADNSQKWEPWQKIEVQISAKKARIIHGFGRLFVFWLQKTEKEKQIEDMSIDDSTLAIHYVFQKVDNSWSAQQKLPLYIKRDSQYEARMRDCLYEIDLHKQHIAGRKENDSANEYCQGEIKRNKNLIKKEIERLKGIELSGRIDVGFSDSTKQKILIISSECGFNNSSFALKENLESTTSYISYFDGNSNADAAKASITESYNELRKKYEEEINNKKEIIKGIEEREQAFYELKKEITERETFQKKTDSIVQQLGDVSVHTFNIKKAVKDLKKYITDGDKTKLQEGDKLAKDLKDRLLGLTKGIDEIQKDATGNNKLKNINDELKNIIEKEGFLISVTDLLDSQAKKEVLQAIGEILKTKLDQAKDIEDIEQLKKELQDVLSEVDKLEAEAIDSSLESRLKDVISKMNSTISAAGLLEGQTKNEVLTRVKEIIKKRIEDIIKLAGDFENLKQPEKAISDLKQEEDGFKKEELRLQSQKEELKKDVAEDTINKRKKELDDREREEKKLIEEMIRSRNDNSQRRIDDEKVLSLVSTLYKNAYIKGLEAILVPEVQQQTLDFKGFYGVYLWEIFFHIPTLIAYLFNQEQNFSEARKWYQYIFNPTKKGCDSWQFALFKAKCPPSNINDPCDSGELVDSLDPYKEADNKKTSYEKYVIMSYVDNLIDWGDMLFSQASWEGINQATMLYIRAWDLLGEKPKKKGKYATEGPKNVCELLDNKTNICKIEASAPVSAGSVSLESSNRAVKALDTIYCSYFCTPENKEFIDLWDRIEDRLYKIRHCLDIKGKRLELPLFQPPIDPRQLISATAGGSTMRLPKIAQVPHYRFKYMITYAKSIADTVTQIGSELLSALEKKDAEALTLLYNKQEGIMANLMTTIKEKAIEALKEESKALNTSLSSAKDRKSHYEKLINDGLSGYETAAIGTAITATVLLALSVPIEIASIVGHLMPKVFGLAFGGFDPGKAVEAGAKALVTTANALSNISQNISTSASYERRAQDWDLQKIMATHDTEQISHQIEANKINQANAEQDLKAHKESIKQIKEKEEFFRSKFTNQELYSWMKGELKSLYIRVYRLALEIARQAEWTYQYEIDNDRTFIQPGHWNSLKEGLLSGQKLKFELEQLDKEYHDTNERRLEIAKVISLKHLDPIALYDLKTKGSCKFSLTEKLFDLDFPGHYARKVKDIKITIPAVVGPYENIHASLQQTSNQVVLKSEGAINAIKYLVNPSEEEQPENDLLRVNWKPNQEIAISKADQDSGLFELSFGDERYLPFEGTGAVSNWELSLPQATNRFDTSTISDVIIHLDYTALNGGQVLSGQVKNLDQIKYYQGTLVANLSTVYPEEWEKFKQAQGRSSELKFKLSPEIFPVHIKNPSIDLSGENSICIIPITSDTSSRMTIKLNNYNWEHNSKKIINPSLTIGSDWNMQINNADISRIEEIMIMVPYKADISW